MKHLLFCLVLTLPAWADVTFKAHSDRVDIAIGGKPYSTFFFGPETMKPYLHPLRAADGTTVSRMYPMEQAEGETRDHPHHQGVWFTHGMVNGYDFWGTAKQHPKAGKVALDGSKRVVTKGGAKSGTLQAHFQWLDPNGTALLAEERRMTFYDDDINRVVDFDIRLTALKEPVKFGDTKEGTFAIRINDDMSEKRKGGMMTSSTGAKGMKEVWGKAFPWVDYAGTVDGKELGIAIFDHPQNPKHPTFWHARDYGLFAANIFGEHDFFADKTRDGSVTLAPGKSLRFRYRVVVHPGGTDQAKLEAEFGKYAGR